MNASIPAPQRHHDATASGHERNRSENLKAETVTLRAEILGWPVLDVTVSALELIVVVRRNVRIGGLSLGCFSNQRRGCMTDRALLEGRRLAFSTVTMASTARHVELGVTLSPVEFGLGRRRAAHRQNQGSKSTPASHCLQNHGHSHDTGNTERHRDHRATQCVARQAA